MKEIKLYECEICHTRYADRQKAMDCEKSHVGEPKIIESCYSTQNPKYPCKLVVEFKDGKRIIYKMMKHLRELKKNDNFSESQQKIVNTLEAVNRAHWIDNHNGTLSCSYCDTWVYKDSRYSYMRYCPYCGKKMVEDESNEEKEVER